MIRSKKNKWCIHPIGEYALICRSNEKRLSPSTCWFWITWMALLLAEKLKVHPVVATEESAQKLSVSEGLRRY